MLNYVIKKAVEEIGNDEVVQKYFNEIKDFLAQRLSEVAVRIPQEIKEKGVSGSFEEELEQHLLITIVTMRKGREQIFDNMIGMVKTGDFIKNLYEALNFQHNVEDKDLH